jgi:hypothetical protein
MAKIIFTLEDARDDSGTPVVSMDMSKASGCSRGHIHPTPAVLISEMLWGLASCERILGTLPPHRKQPHTNTIH